MKLVEMNGLTGKVWSLVLVFFSSMFVFPKVKFNQRGLRTDFSLEIIELKKHGLERVGTWQ